MVDEYEKRSIQKIVILNPYTDNHWYLIMCHNVKTIVIYDYIKRCSVLFKTCVGIEW